MGDETPCTASHSGRETTVILRVLEHTRLKRTLYTVTVVDQKDLCTGVRAICHVQPLAGVMLAIAHELGLHEAPPSLPLSAPAELAPLLEQLRSTNQDESHTAAERLELLWWGLQHLVAEKKRLEVRLEKLGCHLEKLANQAHVADEEPFQVRMPTELFLQLLTCARDPQEGCRVYQELQLLRELAAATADTMATINNWLGHAGTRESAMDSIWRLTRILASLGWELPTDNLRWRGQLVRALDEAGIGLGDDDVIRVRLPEDHSWQAASGAPVKALLESLTQPVSSPASS